MKIYDAEVCFLRMKTRRRDIARRFKEFGLSDYLLALQQNYESDQTNSQPSSKMVDSTETTGLHGRGIAANA